jgi:thiol:disulfide interchange protein DsbD
MLEQRRFESGLSQGGKKMDEQINPEPHGDDGISNVLKSNHVGKLFLLVMLIALAIMCLRLSGPKDALASSGWSNDWNTAVAQSKSTGKPALVLFTANWCPACKQLESQVLTDPKVKQYLQDNYTLVTVDLSDRNGPNNDRARDFGIHVIPTLILYNAAGSEISRGYGMSADTLLLWLRSGGTAVKFNLSNQ